MNIVEEAFRRLYPEKSFEYSATISYNSRFSAYNANVRRVGKNLDFSLSAKWHGVSDEIVIGLIQELLIKILKLSKRTTSNMELYNSFIKNLHISARRIESEPELIESFERVNEQYFSNSLDQPNLVFGSSSFRKLAHYNYQTDTIVVSDIFRNQDQELIDYLIYHELLHKKLKFYSTSSRNVHHSSEFRKLEKLFANSEEIEKRLTSVARRKRFSFLG